MEQQIPHLVDIARAEEAQAALALREIARESIDVAGGIAARESDGRIGETPLWVDRAEGLGMNGPVERSEVDRLVAWYGERGLPSRVQIAPYADPSLLRHLGDAGFMLKSTVQVFFRRPRHTERIELPAGLKLRIIDRADERAAREVSELSLRCFTPPATPWLVNGEGPPERDLALSARAVGRASAVTVGVFAGSQLVATGGVELSTNALGITGALYAGVVAPGFRRAGLQRALLLARMAAAAERGATFVMVGSDPGGPTERNALRLGFTAAYSKLVLTRPCTVG